MISFARPEFLRPGFFNPNRGEELMPKKSSPSCSVKGRLELEPGDHVVNRRNPHDQRAEDIDDTVITFQPSVGFGGCDLVNVHYKHPRTGHPQGFGGASAGLEVFDGDVVYACFHVERARSGGETDGGATAARAEGAADDSPDMLD
ncbi:MAG: hypothetical protein ABR915_19105 [Thermoguttaceae bacterium]